MAMMRMSGTPSFCTFLYFLRMFFAVVSSHTILNLELFCNPESFIFFPAKGGRVPRCCFQRLLLRGAAMMDTIII